MAKELGDTLLALLFVAIGGGVLSAIAWKLRRAAEEVVVPQESATVLAGDVVLSFFLWFLWQWLVYRVLDKSPGLLWVYGREPEQISLGLWTATVSSPFVVLSIVLTLSTFRGIRPSQLGLATSRVWSDLGVGYLNWLALTPPLLLMYFAISLLVPLQKHPFELVGQAGTPVIDWVLFILSAVVMAPVVEELLFRGIVLRWLIGGRWESHLGLAVAAVLAAAVPMLEPETQVTPEKAFALETHVEPAPKWASPLLIVAFCPGYAWLVYKGRAATSRTLKTVSALYGSALLFAALHGRVWPSPIPLFFLGLGLGWVAYRTGGLVAPVFMHSLFNVVGCIQVILARMSVG